MLSDIETLLSDNGDLHYLAHETQTVRPPWNIHVRLLQNSGTAS